MKRNWASLSSHGSGAGASPLTLIHRNNCSNLVSMRVPARLTLENITPRDMDAWLEFLSGPVGQLMLKRRVSDAS